MVCIKVRKRIAVLFVLILMIVYTDTTCYATIREMDGLISETIDMGTENETLPYEVIVDEEGNCEIFIGEGTWNLVEEVEEGTSGEALTPDGNLTLIDDIGSSTGEGQQFITLVTKEGNYFYLIIDRNEKGEENVYFLNLVDEADLFSLMDEDALTAYEKTQTKIREESAVMTEPQVKEEMAVDEKEEVTEGLQDRNKLHILSFTLVGVGLTAGGFVFLFKKRKRDAVKQDPDADYRDEMEEICLIPEEVEDENYN